MPLILQKLGTRASYMFAIKPFNERFFRKIETKHYYKGSDGRLYTLTEVHNPVKTVNTFKEELDSQTIEILEQDIVDHEHFSLRPEHYITSYKIL